MAKKKKTITEQRLTKYRRRSLAIADVLPTPTEYNKMVQADRRRIQAVMRQLDKRKQPTVTQQIDAVSKILKTSIKNAKKWSKANSIERNYKFLSELTDTNGNEIFEKREIMTKYKKLVSASHNQIRENLSNFEIYASDNGSYHEWTPDFNGLYFKNKDILVDFIMRNAKIE